MTIQHRKRKQGPGRSARTGTGQSQASAFANDRHESLATILSSTTSSEEQKLVACTCVTCLVSTQKDWEASIPPPVIDHLVAIVANIPNVNERNSPVIHEALSALK